MTMMWVGIGSAVVGAGAQMYSANKASSNRPGPAPTLAGPQTPGGFSSNWLNGGVDPYTGQTYQYSYGFDPQSLQSQWDSDAMYNQFMGMGNDNITGNIDWQIKKLQQDLDRYKTPDKGVNRGVKAADYGIDQFVDPQTGKLYEWLSDPDGIQQGKYGEAGKKIVNDFYQITGGNYGMGFGNWLKDHVNRNVQPKYEKFFADQKVQTGNQDNNEKTIADLQNQIDYLTQAKSRYAPGGEGTGSNNPLLKYTNDIGPTWQGGGDNTNPYRQSWEEVMRSKMAQDGQNPDDIFKEYGLTGPNGEDLFRSKMEALLGPLGNFERANSGLAAPRLDNGASGNMLNALNFRTQQNFANQRAGRDAQLARRGMASSAVNELAGAQDNLLLGQGLNENALSAANYFNDNVARQFGMDAQAVASNNSAIGQNNAADLARRGLQLQYTNSLNDTDMARAQFALQAKNNIFGQAMSALNANNAMRNDEYARRIQDYTNAGNENQRGYERNMNMYNLLSTNRNNAFAQSMQRAGLGNQTMGTMMPYNMQLAGNTDNVNAANAQMQNSWQMSNWQMQNQADQARANALTGLAGNVAGAFGNYYGSRPSGPTNGTLKSVQNGTFQAQYAPVQYANPSQDPVQFLKPTGRG